MFRPMDPTHCTSAEEKERSCDLNGSPENVIDPDLPFVWKTYSFVPACAVLIWPSVFPMENSGHLSASPHLPALPLEILYFNVSVWPWSTSDAWIGVPTSTPRSAPSSIVSDALSTVGFSGTFVNWMKTWADADKASGNLPLSVTVIVYLKKLIASS